MPGELLTQPRKIIHPAGEKVSIKKTYVYKRFYYRKLSCHGRKMTYVNNSIYIIAIIVV